MNELSHSNYIRNNLVESVCLITWILQEEKKKTPCIYRPLSHNTVLTGFLISFLFPAADLSVTFF